MSDSLTSFAFGGNTPRMTSKEISEMVGSRHDKVKQSIKRLVRRNIIKPPLTVKHEFFDATGRRRSTSSYVFQGEQGKKDSFVVLAQIAPQYIGNMVDAWGRTESSLADLLSALEAFDVPKGMQDMYVYAIREKETGRIKLGISIDPEERLKQLQTGNSQTLELVAYCKANNRFNDERAAHLKAKQYHIRGEWFAEKALEVIG